MKIVRNILHIYEKINPNVTLKSSADFVNMLDFHENIRNVTILTVDHIYFFGKIFIGICKRIST